MYTTYAMHATARGKREGMAIEDPARKRPDVMLHRLDMHIVGTIIPDIPRKSAVPENDMVYVYHTI
jgi:hypothetical protein